MEKIEIQSAGADWKQFVDQAVVQAEANINKEKGRDPYFKNLSENAAAKQAYIEDLAKKLAQGKEEVAHHPQFGS